MALTLSNRDARPPRQTGVTITDPAEIFYLELDGAGYRPRMFLAYSRLFAPLISAAAAHGARPNYRLMIYTHRKNCQDHK
jgi:hypothetical protein